MEMNTEYRNAKYNADGTIDCELNHPIYSWINFTASPLDCEAHGRAIFAGIVEQGDAIEYQQPQQGE